MLKRYYNDLSNLFTRRNVLVIYGARRTGKTTLLKEFLANSNMSSRYDTGDNINIRQLFEEARYDDLIDYAGDYDLIAIDEAQEILNISKSIKILADHTDTKIILTGSSSFKIAQDIGEPLTGRKRSVKLFPFSISELRLNYSKFDIKNNLEKYMLYGTYPEIITGKHKKEKILILNELVESYLLKDIFAHERIRSPKVLVQILKLLAYQIASEVSMNELARKTGVDVKTVSRYLDMLEKCFVIFRLTPYSRNLRNEITSKSKFYFWDLGIRNALISQFAPLSDRIDNGAMFENFIIIERMKKHTYEDFYGSIYFWRQRNGREIDLIEEIDGKQIAVEIKFSPTKKPKLPNAWLTAYPDAEFKVINRENFLNFIS